VTDDLGQIRAIMHAAAGAVPDADAANVKADVVLS
jgi:flagellar biosynthesis/type III secretory pathway M-ring protein FliF/YscJ